ncbi:MAG TPA: hypothetical protein VGR62_12435 [Candidatus Binatia bacterium]|jgi:hypothetical protein|nr:hypothetical protein [Candidatus Binatia bacterium]
MERSSIGRSLLLLSVAIGSSAATVHADGNVSAVVRGGQLILRGDNADNQIRVSTDGAPAGGVRLIPGLGTAINGVLVPFLDVPDVPRGIRAGFGGGEDTFFGREFAGFTGDMIVDMGGQNDSLSLDDLSADRCDFSFGAGHDNFGFTNLACAQVSIRGGGGDDRTSWIGGSVSGATSIGMGSGPDGLTLRGITFGGPVRVLMSGGDDSLRVAEGCTFQDTAYFSGGAGTANGFDDDGTNAFAIPPVIVHFQQ